MKHQQMSLIHILMPQGDGTWQRVIEPMEINKQIINANRTVMKSAQHTLPASDEFQEMFGEYGNSSEAEELISNGEI